MTKKRLFGTVKGYREHIVDNSGRLYSDGEVADLLNSLNDENEQLKKFIKQRCPMCRANLELFYTEWKDLND